MVLVTPASLQMWESPEDMDLNEVSECLVSQRIVFPKHTCVSWLPLKHPLCHRKVVKKANLVSSDPLCHRNVTP